MDPPNVRLLLQPTTGWGWGGGLGQSNSTHRPFVPCREEEGLSECGSGGLGVRLAGGSGLGQSPFLGWKIWAKRANVFLSPKEFPGLPSGKKAAPCSYSSQLPTQRPGTTEMPGPPVIGAGRKRSGE